MDKQASDSLATTRFTSDNKAVSQASLVSSIQAPGAPQREVSELFSFHRPHRASAYRESTIVKLSSKQHDIMYALAGCSDVGFVLGRVRRQVRTIIQERYGIEKVSFNTWFKNRRLAPKKSAPQPQGGGTAGGLPATHSAMPVVKLEPEDRDRASAHENDRGGHDTCKDETAAHQQAGTMWHPAQAAGLCAQGRPSGAARPEQRRDSIKAEAPQPLNVMTHQQHQHQQQQQHQQHHLRRRLEAELSPLSAMEQRLQLLRQRTVAQPDLELLQRSLSLPNVVPLPPLLSILPCSALSANAKAAASTADRLALASSGPVLQPPPSPGAAAWRSGSGLLDRVPLPETAAASESCANTWIREGCDQPLCWATQVQAGAACGAGRQSGTQERAYNTLSLPYVSMLEARRPYTQQQWQHQWHEQEAKRAKPSEQPGGPLPTTGAPASGPEWQYMDSILSSYNSYRMHASGGSNPPHACSSGLPLPAPGSSGMRRPLLHETRSACSATLASLQLAPPQRCAQGAVAPAATPAVWGLVEQHGQGEPQQTGDSTAAAMSRAVDAAWSSRFRYSGDAAAVVHCGPTALGHPAGEAGLRSAFGSVVAHVQPDGPCARSHSMPVRSSAWPSTQPLLGMHAMTSHSKRLPSEAMDAWDQMFHPAAHTRQQQQDQAQREQTQQMDEEGGWQDEGQHQGSGASGAHPTLVSPLLSAGGTSSSAACAEEEAGCPHGADRLAQLGEQAPAEPEGGPDLYAWFRDELLDDSLLMPTASLDSVTNSPMGYLMQP